MTTLDLKAIAWFGDMYQKFEANTVPIYQDSIKYVENHVETVSACVEKFYSELLQNTLPLLSNDPVEPENPGLQLVHCADNGIVDKSELDISGKQVAGGNENLSSDSYLASELDGYIDDRVSSRSCNLCNEMDECHEIDECVASTSTISSSSSPTVGVEFGNDEDVSKRPYGISCEQVRDEIEQQLDEIKLDESCVLVDKHEHLSVSHLDGKQGSYKKKIRYVFYPRRWSRSKNREQLNRWNEDSDTADQESRKIMVAASTLESCNTNLQSNSLESGWEIL